MAAKRTSITLPVSTYQLQDGRASCKRLVGCYPEILTVDGMSDNKEEAEAGPVTLRRWPGITSLVSTNKPGDLVRGMWEMAGTQYAVIGTGLYSVAYNPITSSATLALLNATTPIPGNGFVRMTDNGACMVILVPGTTNCYTYTPFAGGGNFQTLTASFFQNLGGAIDCWYVDTYIVFLANNNGGNGSYTFFNDDGRQVSGNAQITFTTAASFSRQFGTDPFYAMVVDHREVVMLGSRTTEGFVNTGNPTGSPFSAATDTYMPYGVHPQAQYSAALQDNAFMWVANDCTVRRRNGQTPVRISNPGIEAIIQNAQANAELTGCYAITPTWHGHPMWILTIPLAGRTLAYDCVTQQWFELSSVINGTEAQYRVLTWYNGFGIQLVGDQLTGTIGFLDPQNETEFGSTNPQVCGFIFQPIYKQNIRIIIRRVELMLTAGQGTVPGQSPDVDLLISGDWGTTFESIGDEDQTLGVPGDFTNRTQWYNLGQWRSAVLQARVTQASPVFTVDATADIEMCLN